MKKDKLLRLLILAGCTFVFCLLVMIIDRQPIGPNGTTVGFAALNGAVSKIFPFKNIFYVLTNLLGYIAILVCLFFAFIGALQLYHGKSLKKVDREIIALGLLYIVVIVLYVLFEKAELNYRPVIIPGDTEPEASFPSSHTMLAMVVFCSAPWILKKYLKDAKIRNIVTICSYVLAALTVLGRILSGVHWITDIIASILISATLLYGFRVVLDIIRPKKAAKQ